MIYSKNVLDHDHDDYLQLFLKHCIQKILKMHEIISLKWCQHFGVHVYMNRIKSLEDKL